MKDFLPASDAELLAWSSNFSQMITAQAVSIGLTAAQATAYAALHTAWSAALELSTEPSTRTRGTISAKNDARTPLKAMARELARIINAFPGITNQQRIDLGLNPRASEATPINPPADPPVLEVVSAVGRTLHVRLHALNSERRGKPESVWGASLFSFVGAQPPANIKQWVFQGSSARTSFDVEFDAETPAGSQVWLTAFWVSPRLQSGPACQPVSAYLAGGVNVSQAS